MSLTLMGNPWIKPLTGSAIGGYRLDKCIGEGGFCLVFEATNIDTDSRFAVKVLPPSGAATAQADFDNERVLLGKLNRCSSVINLVESSTDYVPVTLANGTSAPVPFSFHALTLASGTVEELLVSPESLQSLAWPERLSLWRGAIKAVHQMHLKSVAHRDLKSSNCLILVVKTRSEVRIADLGRSKDLTQLPTHSLESYLQGMGDFRYAAPEHLWVQGGATAIDFKNADLYGLGSLLVELTTGHPMTALAMSSWSDARRDGLADLAAGVTRDLATLRPQFHGAIAGICDDVPPPIRAHTNRLLTQLCDPVPAARQPSRAPGKRYAPGDGLLWLLRQADILRGQLNTSQRRRRYTRSSERTA